MIIYITYHLLREPETAIDNVRVFYLESLKEYVRILTGQTYPPLTN